MIRGRVPETEHPGVYVEETDGKPKPIEGVPTDALTPRDRRRWIVGLVIGGFVLAGLAVLFATTGGDLVAQLFVTPPGALGFIALLVGALLLGILRRLLEWRRRVAGRASLPLGRIAFGLAVFMVANLVAVTTCGIVLAVVVLAGWDVEIMLTATIHLLVGGVMVQLVLGSLRDISLLAAAVRDHSSEAASLSRE